MLAHQGGWDEILLPALFVLALIALPALRDRRRGTPASRPAAHVRECAYCGERVMPTDARCARCGFRTGNGARAPRGDPIRGSADSRPLFRPAKRCCPYCGRVNPIDLARCPACLREIPPWEGWRVIHVGTRAIRRLMGAVLGAAVLASACTGSGNAGGPSPTRTGHAPVQVIVANYEIVAGESSRLLVGLITEDGRTVANGTVQMRFAQDTGGAAQATQAVVGTYLPVYGTKPADPDAKPTAIRPSTARGVYAVYGVRFLEPGPYIIEVAADVEGVGIVQGAARFEVIPEPEAPGVGEKAPRTANLTLDSKGVPQAAIDSRASTGGIPDPELHRTTIAEAIRRGRPALVVFSTPVFCVSRFCGPVTDLVQDLAAEYGERAEFIHVEIWRDFQDNVVNKAAADWLYRGDELTEPWAFLIGPDGRIAARWDNLFTEGELRPALDELLGKA